MSEKETNLLAQNPALQERVPGPAVLPGREANPTTSPTRKAVRESWVTRLGKTLSIGLVVLIAAHFLALMACALVWQWAWLHEDEVQKSVSAGQVISITQSGGFFSRGTVETNLGYYFLNSPLSVTKQGQLSLEYRGDHSRYLCDAERHCAKLMGSF